MRVTNKRGMKFDCTKLMNWAEELLGPSKCNTIAFTFDTTEESLGWYDWDNIISFLVFWFIWAVCAFIATTAASIF